MRGRERGQVGGALLLAATASGTAAGVLLAAVLAWLPDPPLRVVVVLLALAAAADLLTLHRGRPAWCVARQVPQAWGRLFSRPTTAALYGARLGVGPLTVLPTWLWWAASVPAAVDGPAAAAVTGAVFGAVRAAVLVAAGAYLGSHARVRAAGLRAAEGRVAAVLAAVAIGIAASA